MRVGADQDLRTCIYSRCVPDARFRVVSVGCGYTIVLGREGSLFGQIHFQVDGNTLTTHLSTANMIIRFQHKQPSGRQISRNTSFAARVLNIIGADKCNIARDTETIAGLPILLDNNLVGPMSTRDKFKSYLEEAESNVIINYYL